MSYIAVLGAALVLILVISTDLFVCGFGYGTSKLHVPFRKVLVINVIGSMMMGAGLFLGYFIGSLLNASIANWIAFGVLFGLGLFKFTNWLLTKKQIKEREVRPISWRESIVLAVALSVDNLAVSAGVVLDDFGLAFIFTVIGISLITNHLIFALGQLFGKRVTKKIKLNLSWLSGALLMGLAIAGLFLN